MNYVTYGTTLGIRDATWRVAQQRGGCQRCTQRLQRTPRQTFADISEEYPRLVGVRLGWLAAWRAPTSPTGSAADGSRARIWLIRENTDCSTRPVSWLNAVAPLSSTEDDNRRDVSEGVALKGRC